MYQKLRTLIVAAAILPLGSLTLPAQAQEVVKFGAAQVSAGSLPVIVAEQKGLFAAEGLKYERLDFKGGAPAAQALAAGSLDVCICAADHAIRLEERGLGGKVLVGLADQHSYALIGAAGSKAKSLADLKGQKIGITSAGSLTDTTIRYAIKEAGLDPDKDFEILAVGRAGAQRAALQAGAIAAGMFTTPDIQITMADKGAYKIIEDFRSMAYPAQDLVVTDTWLKANPEKAAKITRAVVKAMKLIQEDKTIIYPAVKEMFPGLKDEALLAQIATDVTNGYLSKDGLMTRASYDTLMKMMMAADPRLKAIPYDDIMVTTYLPK
ncbi:ABC transporter substrate-binding protein [Aquabacter spiritensis]|uniref:NitT/TauT family transport system substrate-binding protein n=1 Tax=Aquabacter spiritensis TaxID=933073 RepID=A0A4R3M460_9HYPH|nr:ABC transporter substrate-binding protein [Aquabacter spiritensis]TCT06127.1 NitT/TauT family transport system substrate-binding protein [Aquabacter spiritensis]